MNKTPLQRQIRITPAENDALVCALEFLSHCEDYTCEGKLFDWKTISTATEKLEANITIFSKSELSAFIAAIELALQSIHNKDSNYEQVSSIYPELIPELEDADVLLQHLIPRLKDYFTDLS